MSKEILVEVRSGKREIALMEDRRLLFFSRESAGGLESEQVYLGVVDRIVKGVEAAFVRLSKDDVGFLPFSECPERPRSGDRILVQIKRPPTGEKAAYLTRDIALAGRYAILMPQNACRAVSKRVTDEKKRAALMERASRLAPEGMGLVMRLESAGEEETALSREIAALKAEWQEITARCARAAAPCLIKGREDSLLRLFRDEHGDISRVLANAPEALPPLPVPVEACAAPFQLYEVRAKLEKSFQRRVWLPCGGYLVWDRTEALTVIDVNSGKFTGTRAGKESAFLRLNVEAAREIARLLRLKNAGGIILIDFVDMLEEESRVLVTRALEEALRDDPVKTVVHGFTTLGLIEMTRKKTEDSAPPLPICPRCHGTGLCEEA